MAYTPIDPAVLTGVLNNQGTQATSANQTIQTGLLTTGNAIATVVMNDQGTLATAVRQDTTNSLLSAIYYQAGTASGSVSTATLFGTVAGPATSVAVDVTGRLYTTVQHTITGTGAVTTQTSLDGINWHTESIDTQSTVVSLVGMNKYVRAVVGSGGTVVSTLLSSQAAGAGASGSPGGFGVSSFAALSENVFSGSLSPTLAATYVLPLNNANSIGFRCVVPTGGIIWFEGSWDGVNWESMTMRQMGAHGYSTGTGNTENWIGSCSTFNYMRWRTGMAGSAGGSVYGKLSYSQNTLEGIEHGPPPHHIGATPVAVVQSIGSICTNQVLYTPSNPYHTLVLTDIFLNGGRDYRGDVDGKWNSSGFSCQFAPDGGSTVGQYQLSTAGSVCTGRGAVDDYQFG